MSVVLVVLALAVTSALLGVFLYGLVMARIAIGPDSYVARHPLIAALWGFVAGAVVSLAVEAVLGEPVFEVGELAKNLAGVPLMVAVGNYTAGRIARRRSTNNHEPLPSSRDAS